MKTDDRRRTTDVRRQGSEVGKRRSVATAILWLGAFTAIIWVMSMQGCGTVTVEGDPAITAARIAGGGLRILVAAKAPQFVPALNRISTGFLAEVGGPNIDLADALGDVMALVTEISQSENVDNYAVAVQEVSAMFSGLIRMNWDVPEEHARAVAIAQAFFEVAAGR